MAATVGVHNMLQRMGLSLEAATEVTNVNWQNLSVLEDSYNLKTKMLKPYAVPSDGLETGGVNADRTLNQGKQVLAMAEANLKKMTYQIHHTIRVSCPVLWTDILIVRVRGKPAHAKMEVSH
jgi:hypothetical protein